MSLSSALSCTKCGDDLIRFQLISSLRSFSRLDIAVDLIFKRSGSKTQRLLNVCIKRDSGSVVHGAARPFLKIAHSLCEIRLTVLRIYIEHLLGIFICTVPFPVLKEHKRALQKTLHGRRGRVGYSRLLNISIFGSVLCKQFPNAANKILHCAKLSEILRLKALEFVRKIVGIHIAEAGDENL